MNITTAGEPVRRGPRPRGATPGACLMALLLPAPIESGEPAPETVTNSAGITSYAIRPDTKLTRVTTPDLPERD